MRYRWDGNGCARRLYGVTILLKCGSYTLKYGGNSLCASLCRNFRIFNENMSSTFSNLRYDDHNKIGHIKLEYF